MHHQARCARRTRHHSHLRRLPRERRSHSATAAERRGLRGHRTGVRGVAGLARVHGRCYRLPGAAAQCPQVPRTPAEPGRRAHRHDFNGTGARANHHAAPPVRSVGLSASASARSAAAGRLALTLIILLACALAAGSWRVYSNTWDEPEHLAAGIELLDRGQYEYDTEHPPLGRVLLALGPYLAGARSFGTPPPNGTQEGVDILYSGGHYWRYLTLARLGTLPFLALLLLATWLWARRLFASQGAALLSVLLLASVPAVLGHAALASLDVAAAATCLLALYALQLWLVSARLRDAARFGLAAGLAVGTKFSAVPFIGLALPALALVRAAVGWRDPPGVPPGAGALRADPPGATARPRLLGLALALLAALLPIAVAYGPRSPNPAAVALRFNWALSYLLQERGLDHQLGVLLSHLWLPRALRDLVNGIVAVKAHNDSGHLSYLLGHVRLMGWWYFYLVALAVKTPIALLAAGPVGMAWLARDGWRSRNCWALAPAVLVILMLTFASAFSRINVGIRHLLVLYPFFALG
ncbi:MAG: phospholipid carrier-dependent glycosyltransferase, partial [Gammaproteobacteria bacterium]